LKWRRTSFFAKFKEIGLHSPQTKTNPDCILFAISETEPLFFAILQPNQNSFFNFVQNSNFEIKVDKV